MPLGADRRLIACGGYLMQFAGFVAFMLAGGASVPLLLTGVVLFGLGFGNANSLRQRIYFCIILRLARTLLRR